HRGRTQSFAWLMRHSGSLVGTLLGGYLVTRVGESYNIVFGITAVFPALLAVGSVLLYEPRSPLCPLRMHGSVVNQHRPPDSSRGSALWSLLTCHALRGRWRQFKFHMWG